LNASDKDEGENARLRYELVGAAADDAANDDDDGGGDGGGGDGGDPDADDDDVAALPPFAVDADTGVVTAVASLDRETAPRHRFQVRHDAALYEMLI